MTTSAETKLVEFAYKNNFAEFLKTLAVTSASDLAAMSDATKGTIVSFLAEGYLDAVELKNLTNANAATDSVRKFMEACGDIHAQYIGDAIQNLANQISQMKSTNFSIIDAITDNLSVGTREHLSLSVKESVVTSFAHSVVDGLKESNQVLVNNATGALRDFMAKCSVGLPAEGLEIALSNLAHGVSVTDSADYRAIDAITDYMSQDSRAHLNTGTVAVVLNAISENVVDGLFKQDSVLVNNSTAALRDFAAKFSVVLTPEAVEEALVKLADGLDSRNSADYRAIDAITDYMSADARAHFNVHASERIVEDISRNLIDGLYSNDRTLIENSLTALRDFATKFSGVLTSGVVEDALMQLAEAGGVRGYGDYRAIDAITDNLSKEDMLHLNDACVSTVVSELARGIVDGNITANAGLASRAASALEDFLTKLEGGVEVQHVEDAVRSLLEANNFSVVGKIVDHMSDEAVNILAVNSNASFDIQADKIKFLSSQSDIFMGSGSSEVVFGRDGNDTIYGQAGTDRLYGGDGDDKLYGGSGTDVLYGGNGKDVLNGDIGNDTLYGDAAADTLNGGDGNDSLYGGSDGDFLYGGAGADVLNGGAHTDILYGGAGADVFVFRNTDTGADLIKDFRASEGDKLDFSNIIANPDAVSSAIEDFVHTTTINNQTIIFIDADGQGAGQAVAVAVLDNTASLDVAQLVHNGQMIF